MTTPPKRYEEMTTTELRQEIKELEQYRQQMKYERGHQATETKSWIRRRKATARYLIKQMRP